MSHPEATVTIVLTVIAIIVLGADILVRVVILPHKRDTFLEGILDHLLDPGTGTAAQGFPESTALPAKDLHECLLRHFEKSGTSRRMLKVLTETSGLDPEDLAEALNKPRAGADHPPLPLAAARRVAGILVNAGLAGVDRGMVRITDLGKELNSLLQEREGLRKAFSEDN